MRFFFLNLFLLFVLTASGQNNQDIKINRSDGIYADFNTNKGRISVRLDYKKAGMLGMANSGPNTNTCEYYITLGDRSYLDGNYKLFGEVVDGMDVVNRIEIGDTTNSITIVRAGSEAEKFIVNNETFKELLDKQWRKVNFEKEAGKEHKEKFVADNYPGLQSMSDGLKFKILTEGKGNKPSDGSVLNIKYTGKLISGLSFVSSSGDGKPIPGSKPVEFSHAIIKFNQ